MIDAVKRFAKIYEETDGTSAKLKCLCNAINNGDECHLCISLLSKSKLEWMKDPATFKKLRESGMNELLKDLGKGRQNGYRPVVGQ